MTTHGTATSHGTDAVGPEGAQQPGAPGVHEVARFGTYEEAQAAIDVLADAGVPVEQLTVVGHGLRYVELVGDRRTARTAALESAASGALIGAIFGFVFGLFDWVAPLISGLLLAGYGAVLGAAAGAALGLLAHGLTGTRSRHPSGSLVAASYAIVADDAGLARRAATVLTPGAASTAS